MKNIKFYGNPPSEDRWKGKKMYGQKEENYESDRLFVTMRKCPPPPPQNLFCLRIFHGNFCFPMIKNTFICLFAWQHKVSRESLLQPADVSFYAMTARIISAFSGS